MASHVWFGEGMNDLPMADIPINVQHLEIVDNRLPLHEEQNFVHASQFELSMSHFTDILPVILKYTPYSSDIIFGFTLQNYDLLKRAFLNTNKTPPASKISSSPISTNNNIRGDFVTSYSW